MTSDQRILVIDDDPLIHRLVAVRIKDLGAQISAAFDGDSGIAMARDTNPHLILLDVGLPDMTGFAVCERLRDDPITREIPVIFLTGTDNADDKVRAFEMGAVDYVTKPFNPAELRARTRAALRTQALLDALETQALSDALTGLPNRESFRRSLARCIEQARHSGMKQQFAIMFLDLDRFKNINDSLGHSAGDNLLVAVANKLYECVRRPHHNRLISDGKRIRHHDIVARMGGDEFAILMHDVPGPEIVTRVAERIQNEVAGTYNLAGHRVHCGVSIGVRMCDSSSGSVNAVLRDSDVAMYHAKEAGKGQFAFFDEKMHERAMKRLQIEDRLRHTLRLGELQIAYQPIIDLHTGALEGFEALVRWRDSSRGFVSPDEFIPVAEETGLIHELGRWVLRAATAQASEWNQRFGTRIQMHVNISKAQFVSESFIEEVTIILNESSLDPALLTAEITESVVMHDSRLIVPALSALRRLGVNLAMDDFGTGYSSLASLHRFPINVLKIDREFIRRLSNSRPYAAIIQAIVALAHNLGLTVVAEGVETAEEVVSLQALDCDSAQGYFFGKAASAEEAEALLRACQTAKQLAA